MNGWACASKNEVNEWLRAESGMLAALGVVDRGAITPRGRTPGAG